MVKLSKQQKRKAKVKAKKQQAIHNQQSLTEHLSAALEKLCESVLPEYIDDSNGPDLTGRHIVWQMGMIAWNIHITGRQELAATAFSGSKLDPEQQKIVQKEIAGLVQRKIELYPRQMTAIRDVAATLVNGSPRAKARPGDTFPEPPGKPVSEPKKPITAEDTQLSEILHLLNEKKITIPVIGCDGLELPDVPANRPVVRAPLRECGKLAAEKIIQAVHIHRKPKSTYLKARFDPRK